MGIFGGSLEDKVQAAIEEIYQLGLGVRQLSFTVADKVVTLKGEAPSLEAKTRVVEELTKRVKCDNILNLIRIPPPPQAAPVAVPAEAPPAVSEEFHVVVRGDTLSALAKKYYGKASLYPRIFEANRDILSDPNLIKVGQRLRIPR
jgi:LysM repeat protein